MSGSGMRSVLGVAVLCVTALLGACAGDDIGDDSASLEAVSTAGAVGVVMVAVSSPLPAPTTDERQHLLYELVLANTDPSVPVRLARIDATDQATGRPVATFRGTSLASRLEDFDTAAPSDGTVPPGAGLIIFLDVSVARDGRLPDHLAHTIWTARGGVTARFAGPTVAVSAARALPLSPPLAASNVLDANGCCASDHVHAYYLDSAGIFLSQRYAIDFVGSDGKKALFRGDPNRNESYFLFGTDVLAAGPGTIVEATDGMAENTPAVLPPFDIQTAAGNHVIQKLDDGRYVLYAHLQTGSVRVQVGQRLACGQRLGRVGNTGNSDAPHLHFQVMDRPSVFEANGLPFVLSRFRLQGTVDLGADDPVVTPTPAPQQRHDRLPVMGDLFTL